MESTDRSDWRSIPATLLSNLSHASTPPDQYSQKTAASGLTLGIPIGVAKVSTRAASLNRAPGVSDCGLRTGLAMVCFASLSNFC
ncbi:hypothetical protein D3C77_716610 [compost metagenome]